MQNNNSIGKAFNDVMRYTYRVYNGVLTEQSKGGYIAFKIWYPTWQKVTEAIDKRLREINEKINIITPKTYVK